MECGVATYPPSLWVDSGTPEWSVEVHVWVAGSAEV